MSALNKYITKPDFIKIKLLDGQSIGIRKWLMGEEKEFLFAIESRGSDDSKVMIEESLNLARKCVDKPDKLEKLSKHNLIYLLSELRKLSKGQLIDFTFYCMNDECDDFVKFSPEMAEKEGIKGQGRTAFEAKIDIGSDKDVTIKRFDAEYIKIDDFKFFIQEVPYSIQSVLDEKYLPDLRLNEWNYNFVIESIKSIEPKGEKKIVTFTREDLIKFVDNQLDAELFKKLSDSIGDKLSDFSIKKEVTCPMCKTSSEVVYNEIFSLMVF